ncbi:MAG: protein jag [Hespellia sp.]|nr:protein jag [Hespellia sp.]
MERSIRISAKTVEEAITNACLELRITSDQLDYEVIEKGSAGFLGIGMKQAVIEAKKKAPKPVEPVAAPVKEETPAPKKEVKAENKVEKKAPAAPKAEAPKKAEQAAVQEETEVLVKHELELAEVEEVTKTAVLDFLGDALKAMNMEVTLTSKIDEEGAFEIDMAGENMGILIGKRGQTLDSLQYLANRVANKHQEGYVRVKLDTENYRSRRKATLENLAKNIAYKVKRGRKPVSLEPMNPYERRIIHASLQNDKYVTTHSEGDEPYRKVVVTLKK